MAEPTNNKPKKLSMGDVMNDPKLQPRRKPQPARYRDDLERDHDHYGPPFMSEEEFLGYTPGDQ